MTKTNKKLFNDVKLMIDTFLNESYKNVLKSEEQNEEQNGGEYNTKRLLTKVAKEEKAAFSKSGKRKTLPPVSRSKSVSLSRFGYKLSRSRSARRRALKRAARSRGTLLVLKRVNLIGNYSKSNPKNYEKLRDDVEYLKDEYAKSKIKKAGSKRKTSKKTTRKTSKK